MNKILIANRSEIAVRILKTAQSFGYETVAVYSEADANAPHVSMADQAVLLGPAEASQSYLNIEHILAAAQKSGTDAIHPGYGFLSEDGYFARRVINAGLIWIGPPPEAMDVMGNKVAAKLALVETDVPCVPGYSGEDQSEEAFIAAASSIGYPVMVKAAAGGGGRGMRRVASADALPDALASAKSEALKAFGSDEILLEKAIVNPRHIEVQVFGDMHGNVIHLGERDCSIQRRHQKVVEEAPSPAVSPELRNRIGQAAVDAAKAVGYYSAGTVEFLLDETGAFYFIEMNTRLQVEHPVTELVTGLDLVAWQLLVAEGEPLPLQQEDVTIQGHAIEVRLYAEDAHNQFLPSIGDVHLWQPPIGDGVRVDHGLASGMAITPYYDAMIAKIITHGETRAIARRRLRRALHQTAVFGVETNRHFLLATVEHPMFVNGEATTNFIDQAWHPASDDQPVSSKLEALAALLCYQRTYVTGDNPLKNWRSQPSTYCFDQENRIRTVTVQAISSSSYKIQSGSETTQICIVSQTQNTLRFDQDGLQDTVVYAFNPATESSPTLWLHSGQETVALTDVLLAPPETVHVASGGNIIAPMPGSIMRIDVTEGENVSKGQSLLLIEAMKMEHTIAAPFDGKVEQILVEMGQQMKPRELMVVLVN
ncbi:MAG: acetyl-CoA carboxylase biotin carboxylase subunit [Chloroflexota bacterium]